MATEEQKIAALAAHLGVDPDEVENTCGDTYVVSEHPIRIGTSPAKAQRLVHQLREALRIGIGPETDAWTSASLRAEAQAAKVDEEHVAALTERARAGEALTPEDLLASALHLPRYTYRNIHTALLATPASAALLKVGLHDVLNTLYFVTPDCEGYSGHNPEEHIASLREAFDGLEVEDRTTGSTANAGEYLVLTDEEADAAWEESLNYYIDDCILPELPETAQRYFDRASWIKDAKSDGRAHSLASYDGGHIALGSTAGPAPDPDPDDAAAALHRRIERHLGTCPDAPEDLYAYRVN